LTKPQRDEQTTNVTETAEATAQ